MSWMHYNPQRADPALLDRITSGEPRLALRDALLDTVRDESKRKSHQHQLLIGARGAGKTHLLRVVAHRVNTTAALERRWRPVVLAEEQSIRGTSELFGALVTRLAADLERSDLTTARAVAVEAKQLIGKARGEVAMRLGFDGLKRIAAALDRKILAVVENLDALFYRGVGGGKKSADDEQWALRKYLQDAEFLMLFGAAPTYFGAASDQGAAFHGFFQEHRLEALPLDEVLDIAKAHLALVASEGGGARNERARQLHERFDRNRGRLAGMLRVTGGLPRFAHLIVDLLIDSEDADAETQLERLLDEQTPYFQGRLDPRLIPSAELEVLATLARASGPLRPSELARQAGVATGEASVLLERLRERGLAHKSGSLGAATAWDVAEPLYRVWMAFREGGEQRSVMVGLTDVVAALYSADELQAEAEQSREADEGDDIWCLAIARQAPPDLAPAEPGGEEKAFQRANAALSQAEATGTIPPVVLVDFVEAAERTGRKALGRDRIESMLKCTEDTKSLRARALLVAARYRGPSGAAQAAAAAALYEELGDVDSAVLAKGWEGRLLSFLGYGAEAVTLLDATYNRAVAHDLPGYHLAWLARVNAFPATTKEEKLRWLDRALSHASVDDLQTANVLFGRSTVVKARTERLDALDRAAAIYRKIGQHDSFGHCLLATFEDHCSEGDFDVAMRVLAEATDLFLEHDAVLNIDVWGHLHDMAVWAPRSAALLAFRELAACVNHETLALKATAESWMVNAATRLIAERTRPHDEMIELLQTARDDLTRERRTLLDPFVFAARMEVEPHESVLFELSEPMRAVIADVRRRVDAVRKKAARPRPAWAGPANAKAQ
jgi:hypothetical protein